MMRKSIVSLIMLCACHSGFAQGGATIAEKETDIFTYPFSDPSPVANPANPIYPYFRFDGFSAKGRNQNWKVVELENPYIKVAMLPEVGGKIWGAMEKSTQKEFLYWNHVLKFRDIAMRGPWTSGGIEFNFGIIGHVPTTSNPVDYMTEKKEDGSVSCYVSSYEWVTGTWWMVEVNLPKDKAYFTTRTTWHNASAIDQPYYQWMNAGYGAQGDARFAYPGTNYIGHGEERNTYPVNEEGRDISTYAGNRFGPSKSYHVLGKFNDFYGLYWNEKDFGSVHHASYADKLGMKIFLWSQSREGGIWEDLLTDKDGQYIELQSGRMFNQPRTTSAFTPFKHASFMPQGTDRWVEYWFPVKETKGIVKAGALGALNVVREDGKTTLYFSPLQKLDTELKVYEGEKLVKTLPMRTDVMQTWTASVPSAKEGQLRVVIGKDELVYSERDEDNLTHRPIASPSDFDWDSVYGLYLQGEQNMNQKFNDKAELYLKKCLEKEPYYAPALTALATLYEREGRYAEGRELARKALSVNTYDGKANYVYGLCNQALGDRLAAKDGFSIASRTEGIRTAAYEKLAEVYMAEENYAKTEDYARKALEAGPSNYSAKRLLMLLYRKAGEGEKAKALAGEVMKDVPLYHPARYEAYKSGILTKEEFAGMIKNEFSHEVYLDMALWYESLCCYEEAVEILSLADGYPIANVEKAYVLHKQQKDGEASELLKVANGQSVEMVFPYRPALLPALEWASQVADNWKLRYYKALVFWANRQMDKASGLLASCEESDYAPLFLCRAALKSGKESLADMKKAESLEESWRTGFALANYYIEKGQWEDAAQVGKKYMDLYPDNYYVGLKYAKALCECGRYQECIDLLKHLTVLPNEGASAGRQVYRAAYLYKAVDLMNKKKDKAALNAIALSKEWPENLGVGKPFDDMIDTRLETYLEAKAQENMGKKAQATKLYEQIAEASKSAPSHTSSKLINALSLRKLGKTAEAESIVGTFSDRDAVEAWCKAVYQGDKDKLTMEQKADEEVAPWETTVKDTDLNLLIHLFGKK